MKANSQRNLTLLGIALLIVMVLVLLASPDLLFSPTVTFIETNLHKSSENRVPVRTKTDFGTPEVMAKFPLKIGKWDGYDFDASQFVPILGADLILQRIYISNDQELFFTIVQSRSVSSFHLPEICFTAQGYKVYEAGIEPIILSDIEWIKGPMINSVPFNKIIVQKTSKDGQVIERRSVLFCYVKGNQFYSDIITMLQTEVVTPVQGSVDSFVREQTEFLNLTIPLMFAPAKPEAQWQPLIRTMAGWGPAGFLIIAFLLLGPLAIIVYPHVRRIEPDP